MGKSERVPDGDNRLSDHQVIGGAHFDGRERIVGLDSEYRQIRVGIRTDDIGIEFPFILKNHLYRAASGDDMGIGQNESPIPGNDHPGPKAGTLVVTLKSRVKKIFEKIFENRVHAKTGERTDSGSHLILGTNIDHGGADLPAARTTGFSLG